MGRRRHRHRKEGSPEAFLLWGTIGVAFLLGLGYWWREPFGQGPDEFPHWLYVRSLVEERRLPILSTDLEDPNFEAHQPPLYYLLAVPFFLLEEWLGIRGKGVALYSLLLGVLLLRGLWLALKEVWPEKRELRWFLVGFVGLLPMQVYLFSRVNNDNLVPLVWLLVWREWGRLLREGPNLLRGAWLGLWLGTALLTKVPSLFLLPPTALLFLQQWRQERTHRPCLLATAGLTVGTMALMTGWWFLRNRRLYGDFLAHRVFQERFRDRVAPEDLMAALHLDWFGYWLFVAWWVYRSFWGVFGHMDRFLPPLVYGLLGFFPLLSLLGWGRALVESLKGRKASRDLLWGLSLFTLGELVLGLIQFNLTYFQAQARYLFPFLFVWGALLWRGWEHLGGPQWALGVGGTLLGLLLVVNLLALMALF